MNEDRAKYNQYVENINKMLKSENFYEDFQKKLKVARPIIKLNKKKRAKDNPAKGGHKPGNAHIAETLLSSVWHIRQEN